MIEYGIATEADWLALPREERARKVGTIMARNFVSLVHSYDATKKK